MKDCKPGVYVSLALTSLALIISICANIIFYFSRRRRMTQPEPQEDDFPIRYPSSSSSVEGEEQQENPIYGNIYPDRAAAEANSHHNFVLYEQMNKQTTKRMQIPHSTNPDVAYASLDLTAGQKGRKRRRKNQDPAQSRLAHSQSQQEFLEVEAEVEARLPAKRSTPMISRSSIYLNSLQMALESDALEVEREADLEDLHGDSTHFLCRTNQSQAFELDSV